MKCPKCGGNALLSNWGSYVDPDYADFHVECERCGYHSMGSTEPQKAKEMFEKGMGMYYTNEDWLRQASKEEMEHALTMLIMKDRFFADKEFAYVNIRFGVHCWLKEKHDDNMGRNP